MDWKKMEVNEKDKEKRKRDRGIYYAKYYGGWGAKWPRLRVKKGEHYLKIG